MSKSAIDNPFLTELKDKNGESWYHQIILEVKDKEIEKLKKVISEKLFFQYYLDTKFIDDKNKFLIKVKRFYYNEKQFKCIWWIWKSDAVERYINIDKTFEKLQEIINDYLKDNP